MNLDFGYDENLRSTIYTDLLHDAFTHAVLKGFSWPDVCNAVQLTQSLLTQLIGKLFQPDLHKIDVVTLPEPYILF